MGERRLLRDDDRGVSSALGYVLTLAISGILVTGLLVGGGSMVSTERDVVAREQLSVAAEQLATGMTDADRLAATSDDGAVRIEVWLPDGAGSAPYSLRLESQPTDPDQPHATRIVAESPALDVSQSVVVRTTYDVAESTVDGGPVVVTFDADDGDGTLHVHDADDVALDVGGTPLALQPPVRTGPAASLDANSGVSI